MTRDLDRRTMQDALRLDLDPNEGSGMIRVEHDVLCAERGWDLAFWVCLDDVEVDECIALVGHRWGNDLDHGWEIDRLEVDDLDGADDDTEDAEGMARWDGFVYVFGSHFGSKDGPIQRKRAFIARFDEHDVGWDGGDPEVDMEVRIDDLLLHRVINDALADSDVDVIEPGGAIRAAFIDRTREEHEGQDWVDDLEDDDRPINIEGAAFRADGSLVVGLRYPVAADGRPFLVELAGIPQWFEEDDEEPEVVAVWVVDAVGRDGELAGIRDLTALGSELHLITGNIDSRDKGSVLLDDHPEGKATVSTHWRCVLPWDRDGGNLEAEALVEFPDMPRVEGIATDPEGRFYYVSDEDEHVFVRFTRFLTPEG